MVYASIKYTHKEKEHEDDRHSKESVGIGSFLEHKEYVWFSDDSSSREKQRGDDLK